MTDRPGLGRLTKRNLLPLLGVLFFTMPLWFIVTGSLRPANLPPPVSPELFPPNASLASYERLPRLLPVFTQLRNSATVAVIAMPLSVLVASWGGFGIRLLPSRTQRQVIIGSLIVLLIPVTALWATRFEIFRLAGAVDTFVPLVAPALLATSPFYVLIYAWSFAGIADSQLHAARLEGAGALRIWWRLAMPQSRPATLAVGVLAFTFYWGNFIDPLLYLNRQELFTMPLGLQFLRLLNPTDWPLLMAGCVVVTVPAVAVFLLAQRVLFSDDPLRSVRARSRR